MRALQFVAGVEYACKRNRYGGAQRAMYVGRVEPNADERKRFHPALSPYVFAREMGEVQVPLRIYPRDVVSTWAERLAKNEASRVATEARQAERDARRARNRADAEDVARVLLSPPTTLRNLEQIGRDELRIKNRVESLADGGYESLTLDDLRRVVEAVQEGRLAFQHRAPKEDE